MQYFVKSHSTANEIFHAKEKRKIQCLRKTFDRWIDSRRYLGRNTCSPCESPPRSRVPGYLASFWLAWDSCFSPAVSTPDRSARISCPCRSKSCRSRSTRWPRRCDRGCRWNRRWSPSDNHRPWWCWCTSSTACPEGRSLQFKQQDWSINVARDAKRYRSQ